MINLGEFQTLTIIKKTDNGVYLKSLHDTDINSVLLPKNQVPQDVSIGDELKVFIYRDSEDRLIATTMIPKLTLGEFALLDVKESNTIGAFLDWGLAKDLLLPYKEQKRPLMPGDKVLVSLYIDKSKRLCATSKVYDLLSCDSTYSKGDEVQGVVYDINDEYGAFVAVDTKYCAMIPQNDYYSTLNIGDTIKAHVTDVRSDGKLRLTTRDNISSQIDNDANLILDKLKASNGFLPFNDKSDSIAIKKEFSLSKNSFKKAIGRMYKERLIIIKDDGIYIS